MEENTKRILLVEDDPNFGTVLKEYLTIHNYDVVLAKNGMEGYEKFKKSDFHLCILDVMMPYKDGFTLAQEIREKDKDVPIIFLTAKALKEDVLKGYKVGADDYLNKPFDSEVLLLKIQAIIQRKNVESVADSKQFEFEIGSFKLNSKLRFLTHNGDTQIKLSPKENELSKSGNCSWMEVECLGACVNAPMMQINDEYYEDLDKEKTLDILNKILNGETPKPGSYRGRVNNEPENNRKTLMDLKNA